MKKLFAIMLVLTLMLLVPSAAFGAGGAPQRTVPVTFVAISGYSAPAVNDTAAMHMGISIPEGAHYYIASKGWYSIDPDNGFNLMADDDAFEAGGIYFMDLLIKPISGYAFSDDCGVSINSGAVPVKINRNQGTITVNTPYIVCGAEDASRIHSVRVDGFEEPVEGDSVSDHMALTVPAGAHYTIVNAAWLYGPLQEGNAAYPLMEFEAGTLYTQAVVVIPERGYVFDEDCELLVNGSRTLLNSEASFADPGLATIYAKSYVCGEQYSPGDANRDGSITTEDALLVLRHALNISMLPEDGLYIVDMDGDGSITTVDALVILRMALNII